MMAASDSAWSRSNPARRAEKRAENERNKRATGDYDRRGRRITAETLTAHEALKREAEQAAVDHEHCVALVVALERVEEAKGERAEALRQRVARLGDAATLAKNHQAADRKLKAAIDEFARVQGRR